MNSLMRRFSFARYYYPLYAVACAVVAFVSWVAVERSLTYESLPIRDYSSYRCVTDSSESLPTLYILNTISSVHAALADTLCQSPAIREFFSAVEFHRTYRSNIDQRRLYEMDHHLVLSKPEIMERIAGDILAKYKVIAGYPEYSSQLIALKGVPELNQEYFRGKTVGLLDDPHSLSAYQVPRAALKNSGLEDEINIIYYKTHRQLYEALYGGTVDVIAAISHSELPKGLVLQEGHVGPRWYLHGAFYNTTVHCEILRALKQASNQTRSKYLNRLQISGSCHGAK